MSQTSCFSDFNPLALAASTVAPKDIACWASEVIARCTMDRHRRRGAGGGERGGARGRRVALQRGIWLLPPGLLCGTRAGRGVVGELLRLPCDRGHHVSLDIEPLTFESLTFATPSRNTWSNEQIEHRSRWGSDLKRGCRSIHRTSASSRNLIHEKGTFEGGMSTMGPVDCDLL